MALIEPLAEQTAPWMTNSEASRSTAPPGAATTRTDAEMRSAITQIRRLCSTQIVATQDDAESVVDRLGQLDVLMSAARQLKDNLEQAVIEWIEEHGDLHVPGMSVRYYAGIRKSTKCTDVPKAFLALLEASGGDLDKALGTLASGAIKHGAARGLLAEAVFDSLFVTEEKPELKEGKPRKSLIRVDERFARGNLPHGSRPGAQP